jgi:hypothetical protein
MLAAAGAPLRPVTKLISNINNQTAATWRSTAMGVGILFGTVVISLSRCW